MRDYPIMKKIMITVVILITLGIFLYCFKVYKYLFPSLRNMSYKQEWVSIQNEFNLIHLPKKCYWKRITAIGIGRTDTLTVGYIVLSSKDKLFLKDNFKWTLLNKNDSYLNRILIPPAELRDLSMNWWESEEATLSLLKHQVGFIFFDMNNGMIYFQISK